MAASTDSLQRRPTVVFHKRNSEKPDAPLLPQASAQPENPPVCPAPVPLVAVVVPTPLAPIPETTTLPAATPTSPTAAGAASPTKTAPMRWSEMTRVRPVRKTDTAVVDAMNAMSGPGTPMAAQTKRELPRLPELVLSAQSVPTPAAPDTPPALPAASPRAEHSAEATPSTTPTATTPVVPLSPLPAAALPPPVPSFATPPPSTFVTVEDTSETDIAISVEHTPPASAAPPPAIPTWAPEPAPATPPTPNSPPIPKWTAATPATAPTAAAPVAPTTPVKTGPAPITTNGIHSLAVPGAAPAGGSSPSTPSPSTTPSPQPAATSAPRRASANPPSPAPAPAPAQHAAAQTLSPPGSPAKPAQRTSLTPASPAPPMSPVGRGPAPSVAGPPSLLRQPTSPFATAPASSFVEDRKYEFSLDVRFIRFLESREVNQQHVQSLAWAVKNGQGLEVSLSELDVHAVAKVFKAYLSEHEPLFLFENYEELVQCDRYVGSLRVEALNIIVNELPLENKIALKHLFTLFETMASHVAVTKMDARNIAYTLAPALVRPKVDSKNALTEMKSVNAIIQFIIDNSARVFADRTEEEEAHAGRMPIKTQTLVLNKMAKAPTSPGTKSIVVNDDDDDDGPMSPSLSVLYGNTGSSNPLSPTATTPAPFAPGGGKR